MPCASTRCALTVGVVGQRQPTNLDVGVGGFRGRWGSVRRDPRQGFARPPDADDRPHRAARVDALDLAYSGDDEPGAQGARHVAVVQGVGKPDGLLDVFVSRRIG